MALASSSCASNERAGAAPRVWVGAVQGSDVMVGAVESGSAASLFFCGGPSSFATQTHWFSSPSGLDAPFLLDDGDFQLQGSTNADAIVGTFRQGGDARPFSAQRVNDSPLAGVYDALGPCGHLGLIIQSSSTGESPAAQGACLETVNGAELVEQVNPVMPLTLGANSGVAVTVGSDLTQIFILHPLAPVAGS